MKKKIDDISHICALCVHATITAVNAEHGTPPLLFVLKSDPFDEAGVSLICPYHNNVAPSFSCRKFCFDPLKYRPQKAPAMQKLDEDMLLID